MPTRYLGLPEEVRALNAYIPLMRAASSVEARVQRHLAEAGLTLSQFGALEILLHVGPLCARDLCQKLLTTSGNITLVLDNLEKRGLVRRVRESADRRVVTIHLTPEGEELIRSVFPRHVAGITQVFGALTPDEQEQLRVLCRKLGKQGEV
ncbi:HTH-type transcriptional regulator MhqR [compost metagenome]